MAEVNMCLAFVGLVPIVLQNYFDSLGAQH